MTSEVQNTRPIIGILTQEVSKPIKNEFQNACSYIAASYVKAVEGSGARVVPIFLDQPEDYYKYIVKSINGLVLPGGNTWFYENDNTTPRNDGYLKAAEILYNEIKQINNEMNKNGMMFPILGICLGFELLLFLDAGKKECRKCCKLIQAPLPVLLKNDYKACQWLDNDHNFWTRSLEELLKEPASYFSHQFYVTEEAMEEYDLNTKWNIIATTKEGNQNITFISIVESRNYPIIGLQFHPEKCLYEWKERFNIPHNEKAFTTSRYFFDWLVRLSRTNNQHFETKNQEQESLINNYIKVIVPENLSFDEMYLFNSNNESLFKVEYIGMT